MKAYNLFLLLHIAFLLLSHAASAQQPPFQVGETLSEKDKEALDRQYKRESQQDVGRMLPDFMATTWDGRQISNNQMVGNVYLLVVFHPDCRCLDSEMLRPFTAIAAAHRDFHVLALIQDTAYLYIYREEHREPLQYAVTSTREQLLALFLDHSDPVFILVNRNGIVVKVLSGWQFGKLNQPDNEGDDFVKTVAEVLRF